MSWLPNVIALAEFNVGEEIGVARSVALPPMIVSESMLVGDHVSMLYSDLPQHSSLLPVTASKYE